MVRSNKNEGGFIQTEELKEHKYKLESCDIDNFKHCEFCNALIIDEEIYKTFNKRTCSSCRYDKIKLIPRTNAINDYLLTEEEMNQFKFITKKNPHKNAKGMMRLYLEETVREYAEKKYGDLDKIEELKEERSEKRMATKLAKLKKRVKSMKKRTFVNEEKIFHTHDFKINGKYGK